MKKSKEFIPALRFKALTGFFDPFIAFTIPEKKLKSKLIEEAYINGNESILDFGCGTGTLLIMLKKRFPQITAFGVDIDKDVLEIANKKMLKEGLEVNLTSYSGDELPYEDETFDKVFSTLAFHHLKGPQKKQALREILRVLKPGGKFYLLDFGKVKSKPIRAYSLIWRAMDGLDNTADNINGLIPEFMKETGFVDIDEKKRAATVFGIMSFLNAAKRKNN